MRALEFLTEDHHDKKDIFIEMFKKFLPLAMEIIELKDLPRMVFIKSIKDSDQPTFGSYVNDEKTLYVALANRHPNDILRTIAHELTHYKQDTEHQLHAASGTTGSKEENQANAVAGIVMRNFNKRYPEYLTVKPIVLEKWSQKYKRSINCANPKGFSQRAHCQGRKKNESKVIEGVNDPAIFKVIFVVGGPGSGKSYISRQLGLSALGYVTINSDVAFEYLMKKQDLDFKMPPEQQGQRDVVRQRAKDITANKTQLSINGRLGLVIDGTGDDFGKISKLKTGFDILGYDSFLVVVNTKLNVARQRNQTRSRTVPDETVVQSWHNVQTNIGKFVQIFSNVAIIDNNNESTTDSQIQNTYKKIVKFTNQPPSKQSARKWIDQQKQVSERLNRTDSRELVIFDIDDTLLHTTALINVVRDGKVIRTLNNQEFNNYKLGPGEEFDFGQFRDAAKFEEESIPIGPMLDRLRTDLASGKNVVMLTARADFNDQKAVWRTFKRHGIDINRDVHLFRAGNLPGDSSPAVKKAIHVSEWLSTGKYNKITMYDDSEKNLAVFKSLEKRFPDVEFEAHHVSEGGETKQVEESTDMPEYVYHASYLPDQNRGLLSIARKGLTPSRTGQMGPGLYFAYDPEGGYYHVDPEDATMFRVKWNDLVKLYGVYPKNPKGIQRDNEQILVPGSVPANMLEVEYFPDEWWDLQDVVNTIKHHSQNIDENFADGKKPGRKGLAKRMGVNCKQPVSKLRSIAKNSSGERQRMAHWCANMKSGKK